MGDSTIEWCDKTWNCVRGCSRVSEGCKHCYAERLAGRFCGSGLPFASFATNKKGTGPRWTGKVELMEHKLKEPFSWKNPCRVFVNSMSDLWHEELPVNDIAKVYVVMMANPRHTFQVLTKRPATRSFCLRDWRGDRMFRHIVELPNVLEGTSVENRATLHRIDELRETPAAVRFLSLEPLLEDLGPLDLTGIHLVIVGGESGPGARPMAMEWARNIQDQCLEMKIPFFMKQFGACTARLMRWKSRKGGEMAEWPAEFRVRQFPEVAP